MPKRAHLLDRLPFAPVAAAMFALVAAVLVAATPYWLFSHAVAESGLPSILPAATPPLGDKARIVAMLAAALVAGAIAWALAALVERRLFAKKLVKRPRGERINPGPVVGAHSRPPLSAHDELGAPLMSDEAMEVARDELILDAPVVETPAAESPEAVAQDQEIPAAAPEAEAVAEPKIALETLPIAALVARLERGLATRPDRRPPIGSIAQLHRSLGAAAR